MTNAEQTAPRAATVFALMTDPSRIAEWWGPHGVTTVVEEMDVRPGGKWRFLSHHPGGEDHGFRGEYREVTPPEVLVQTFEWMGLPGHVSVETARFEEIDGRTRLTITSRFDTQEDRDGVLASGMEGGLNDTYDRFEALLARGA